MAGEKMVPCLPCEDLDTSLAFYETLGFKRTYRQLRPYAYGVVVREDMQFHLFGMDGFQAKDSYGTVIIALPDPQAYYDDFANRLRQAHGKLPVKGYPRILRPRKKFGTVHGFSIVDPGGNWLRFYKLGDQETDENEEGLAGIVNVAARLGDSQGDEKKALKTLQKGIQKFPEAPAAEKARAYLYQAELAVRLGDRKLAVNSLQTVNSLELTEPERASLAKELASTTELVQQEP